MIETCSLAAYTAGFFIALCWPRPFLSTLCIGIGTAINFAVVLDRYNGAWPMMPMHFGIAGLSVVLSFIWICNYGTINRQNGLRQQPESPILLGIIVLVVAATVFFPKDFYVPFLRSNVIWSHVFLLAGIVAKSFLVHGGVKAFAALQGTQKKPKIAALFNSATNWIVYGYGLLTVSLFSGELWCYLGWGTPVVWHDAALTTVLSLWLYWTCFLHLLFIRSWSQKQRSRFVVAGAVLVLFFACHPDMGPFRLPFQGQG
ncbi:MAG: hypothetical protein COA36_06100 [Desulfotalea sp.]|nr:MAG: hypothetical protein COA36_06100 [Desulfotalea sp.]